MVSKFVDFLIDPFLKPHECSSKDLREESHFDINNPEDAPFLTRSQNRTQTIEGKVTHLFHGNGLINNEIYFSLSDVNGNHLLQVGLLINNIARMSALDSKFVFFVTDSC